MQQVSLNEDLRIYGCRFVNGSWQCLLAKNQKKNNNNNPRNDWEATIGQLNNLS
jgi:hypothetical protein